MKKKLHNYRVTKVLRVVDGDTIYLEVDLGFDIKLDIKVRLLDLNAPEIRGEERDQGIIYKQALKALIDSSDTLTVSTAERGKYGRWIGIVYYNGNKSIAPMITREAKKLGATQ